MNTIELQFYDLDLEVDYTYFEGEPMVETLPSGDPGHPGIGGKVDIHEIRPLDMHGEYQDVPLKGTFHKVGIYGELVAKVIEMHEN